MRVLVVEDDAPLAEALARGLRNEGMAIDLALDGEEGLEKALLNPYDVIVLDRDLPGLHGDEVCRRLASETARPRILMLTAAGALEDRVRGLEMGADDYLAKPFAMRELIARLRALARRPAVALPVTLEVADVVLDPARRSATRAGSDLRLTRKEFGVLEVLLARPGTVVTTEDLLERVWDEATNPFTNTVRVTVMTLRRKLGEPPLVETVPGVGYRVVAPAVPG